MISILVSLNYRSQRTTLPPLKPTAHAAPSTVQAVITSLFTITCCLPLPLIPSITTNLPATQTYCSSSHPVTVVRNSPQPKLSWLKPYTLSVRSRTSLVLGIQWEVAQSLAMRSSIRGWGKPIFPRTSSLQTDVTSQPIILFVIIFDHSMMSEPAQVEQLLQDVRLLLKEGDSESVQFILEDEQPQTIEDLCMQLTPDQRKTIQEIMLSISISRSKKSQVDRSTQNKLIDKHLSAPDKKEDNEDAGRSFMDLVSKQQEKLVYQEQFGYPFYDLIKRIMRAYGDTQPQASTIKAMHSQIQLLYGVLFPPDVVPKLKQKNGHWAQSLREYFQALFTAQCRQFSKFIHFYRNLKKQEEGEEEEEGDLPISQDESLGIQEKEFLVKVAEDSGLEGIKNRCLNFICFGVKKFQSFLSLHPSFYNGLKDKEFCDQISFLSLRFIRKIIFKINRDRHEGSLKFFDPPLTPQEIKTFGNQQLDILTSLIEKYTEPMKSVQQQAKSIFLEQFDTYSYKDFVPKKLLTEAQQKQAEPALYIWDNCKDYQALWKQRVRSERYLSVGGGGERPQCEYFEVLKSLGRGRQKGDVWKDYIMRKFGVNKITRKSPKKRVKLASLNDEYGI